MRSLLLFIILNPVLENRFLSPFDLLFEFGKLLSYLLNISRPFNCFLERDNMGYYQFALMKLHCQHSWSILIKFCALSSFVNKRSVTCANICFQWDYFLLRTYTSQMNGIRDSECPGILHHLPFLAIKLCISQWVRKHLYHLRNALEGYLCMRVFFVASPMIRFS